MPGMVSRWLTLLCFSVAAAACSSTSTPDGGPVEQSPGDGATPNGCVNEGLTCQTEPGCEPGYVQIDDLFCGNANEFCCQSVGADASADVSVDAPAPPTDTGTEASTDGGTSGGDAATEAGSADASTDAGPHDAGSPADGSADAGG